jgi:hypothetical protein
MAVSEPFPRRRLRSPLCVCSTQQRKPATHNGLNQQASVEPRIPRLAGGLRNQQAGMTGGTLQRVVFASFAVLGANGIIGAKRKALRPPR